MIVINFNKKLYNLKIIQSVAKLYKDVADFIFTEKKNYIILTIKNINKEVKDIIKDEFCNYVLSLTKNKK